MPNTPTTAVLIPCLNEEQTIRKVVTDFRRELPDAVIYVYDNRSTDSTSAEAKAAGAIVRYSPERGKGNVLRRMLRDIDADRYVLVDGDDTYPAEDVHQLLDTLDDGWDMVVGDRLSSTYFTENKRPFHNSGNRLVRFAINKAFHAEIRDVMSGYRAFNRLFAKSYSVLSDGFEIETEMTIHALDNKMRVTEVPVQYRDRPDGSESKLNTFSDGFKVLGLIFRLIYVNRPLPFFGTLAVIIGGVGLGLAIWVCVLFWKTGEVTRFPTLIGATMLMLFGIISLFTGLILEVVARKDRARFMFDANIFVASVNGDYGVTGTPHLADTPTATEGSYTTGGETELRSGSFSAETSDSLD
ncbi:glycosyltransferase [Bifidobacterium choloepi]|uniref:Glycosyltransferase n=1 Tax=Bifidobacterium choloepi TaxID=2614131 RepID=A0A6I5N1Y2_9BIFI|nr:glycosyltransferase [Bifidobacterium choloepi]NEG70486.1 glycosyltransferase [Bifidobacterium choloepi]